MYKYLCIFPYRIKLGLFIKAMYEWANSFSSTVTRSVGNTGAGTTGMLIVIKFFKLCNHASPQFTPPDAGVNVEGGMIALCV